jgi:tRNA modification GTPase
MAGPVPAERRASLRLLRGADGAELDSALVLWFPGPGSFTGEDVVEFHCHGSPAVLRAVSSALLQLGLRPAEPGEFTRRALANGRMGLGEVEGLGDLLDAETDRQRRQALDQTSGRLRHVVEGWRSQLVSSLALVEATLDFSDERDVGADHALSLAMEEIAPLRDELLAVIEDARRGMIVRAGFTVVIAGPPNAGKSTLMNALARRDVAIVTPHAGTTRDLISVDLDLGGLAVTLVDTAGLRETEDPVERVGIERAREKAAQADLVLWLTPAGEELRATPALGSPLLPVLTKIDSHPDHSSASIRISALTGEGLPALLTAIENAASGAAGQDHPVLTRARHVQCCRKAAEALARALETSRGGAWPELIAAEIKEAVVALEMLIGRVDVDAVLDDLFSRFCIGK